MAEIKTLTRLEQDLRLLTNEQLTEKYGEHNWNDVRNGAEEIIPFVAEIPEQQVEEPQLIEEELPAPPYKGSAFGRFVMIRRLEEQHTGRLVMPSRIAGTSDVGQVVSVGEECKYIKAGTLVIFDQYAGVGREARLVDSEGLPGTFLLVEEPDILARLEKIAPQ